MAPLQSIMKALLFSFTLLFLIPQMSNTVVWFQFKANQQYIVTELCEQRQTQNNHCQGSCHLAKHLAKTAQPNDNQGAELFFLPLLDLFFADCVSKISVQTSYVAAAPSNFSKVLHAAILFSIDHPPEA